jgi:hypothetical protein
MTLKRSLSLDVSVRPLALTALSLLAVAAPSPALADPAQQQPTAETQATAPAVESTAQEEETSSLVPAWEEERLATREVAAGGIRYRPGKGFELKTADGDFSLTTKLRAQVLYSTESSEEAGLVQVSEGLQIRRARVAFSGNIFGKHNKYKMELAVSPRDEGVGASGVMLTPLLDWNMTFDYLPAATLVVGQYKVPYSRQRVISSGSLQFVDRSIVQGEFNLDRDIGLDIRSSDPLFDLFRYYAGVYIGEGRGAFELTQPGLMYLGRVEVLPFGEFADYVEADFERSLKPRLSVGVAYAYLDNAGATRASSASRLRTGAPRTSTTSRRT